MASFDKKVDFLSGSVPWISNLSSTQSQSGESGGGSLCGVDLDSDYANGRGGKGWEVPGCGPGGMPILDKLYA